MCVLMVVCLCTWMGVQLHAHMCEDKRSMSLSTFFLNRVCHITWYSQSHLNLLNTEFKGSACLWLPRDGIIGTLPRFCFGLFKISLYFFVWFNILCIVLYIFVPCACILC